MSPIVKGVGGQSWAKFCPGSCWMTPSLEYLYMCLLFRRPAKSCSLSGHCILILSPPTDFIQIRKTKCKFVCFLVTSYQIIILPSFLVDYLKIMSKYNFLVKVIKMFIVHLPRQPCKCPYYCEVKQIMKEQPRFNHL